MVNHSLTPGLGQVISECDGLGGCPGVLPSPFLGLPATVSTHDLSSER